MTSSRKARGFLEEETSAERLYLNEVGDRVPNLVLQEGCEFDANPSTYQQMFELEEVAGGDTPGEVQ